MHNRRNMAENFHQFNSIIQGFLLLFNHFFYFEQNNFRLISMIQQECNLFPTSIATTFYKKKGVHQKQSIKNPQEERIKQV